MSPLASRKAPRSLFRPLIGGALLLFALVAVNVYFGLRIWHARQAMIVQLEHSRQVMDSLDRLRTSLDRVVHQKQDFLLSNDPAYAGLYDISDESVRRQARALETLVASDPLESLRASHLALVIAMKLHDMTDIVGAARDSRAHRALAMTAGIGEIRALIDQMLDYARLQLVNRSNRVDELDREKTLAIVAGVAMISALAGAALMLARREAEEREQTTQENIQLQSDLHERESNMRQLIDSKIIGIVTFDVDNRFFDANDAFLDMVKYSREDLISGRLRWTDMTPAEWRTVNTERMAELKAFGTCQAYETEFFRKDGKRVPVLVGGAALMGKRAQGVAFVLDLTERRRAEAALHESERRYREAMTELSHANRVTMMGQLTASIAHEVNQPIAAAVTNASAAVRWLNAQPPELDQAREAIERVVKDGGRAGDVIHRIRALARKAPLGKETLDVNGAILEVVSLTQGELVKHNVCAHTALAPDLPSIKGDRVQLQQVILNLVGNAIEAMSGVADGKRELWINTKKNEPGYVLLDIRDSGPGLGEGNPEQVFNAFYTTKASGMGIGLSICRSIIEAHGGRVWATANVPRGAAFQILLPTQDAQTEVQVAIAPSGDGLLASGFGGARSRSPE
jgi:PAS domain S-box-containing protein